MYIYIDIDLKDFIKRELKVSMDPCMIYPNSTIL